MNIWLDDQRDAPEGWIHVHNFEEIESFMETARGLKAFYVDKMSFDYHLGHPKRGIDVMKYLVELCGREETMRFWPKSVSFHSSDPKGVRVMKAFSESFEKELTSKYKR